MASFLKNLFRNAGPSYVGRGVRSIGNMLSGRNAESYLRTYGSVGLIFAIVDKLTEGTASVDWHLYRKAQPGEEREEVLIHPALALWSKPNPFMDQHEFVETFQQHLDLVGETVWYVGRSSANFGPPLELWPVRPDRVQPIPDPIEFIKGWVYVTPDGQEEPWSTGEVIQLKRPNPLDPYRGLGPVQSILTDIDSQRYSSQWNANFFLNSAEPGGLVELARNLSDAEFEEWRERWDEQHKGVAKAHRPALLEQGAKWVDRKYTHKDMQFKELQEVGREIIREAFGFPKPMLGAVDDVNRANAEAAEVVFARWVINPRLDRIKRALNTKLLPMYGSSGQGLEFDYDDPSPEDKAQETADRSARVESVGAMIRAGFDPAESLEAMGMSEVKHLGVLPVTVQAVPKPEPDSDGPAVEAKADPRVVNEKQLQKLFQDILEAELDKTIASVKEGDVT